MRKKIALILAIFIWSSIFSGIQLDVYAMSSKKLGLIELSLKGGNNQGISTNLSQERLELVTPAEKDEAAFSFPIMNGREVKVGTYILEYYIQGNETYRIEAEFEFKSDYTADVTIKMFKENSDKPEQVKFVEYKDYYGDINDESNGFEFKKTLKFKSGLDTEYEKGLKVSIGGFAPIQMYVDSDKGVLNFSTKNINAGLITPFKLMYSGGVAATDEQTIDVFKGLDDTIVKPTHLLSEEESKNISPDNLDRTIGLPSLELIDIEENRIDGTNFKYGEPGTRPGVVVQITTPKKIKDGKFVLLDDVDGSSELINVKLTLTNPYETGLPLTVKFPLKSGEPVVGFGVQNGVVGIHDGKYEVYISQDNYTGITEKEAIEKKIAKECIWKEIAKAEIYHTELELDGEVLANTNTLSRSYSTDLGYTYVKYGVEKTSETSITFNIEPYKIQQEGTITYILTRNGKEIERRTYSPGDNVSITTNLKAVDDVYQIEVLRASDGKEVSYKSQKIRVDAQIFGELTPIQTNEIISIDNIWVIPNRNINANEGQVAPDSVMFDLQWRAPANLVNTILKSEKDAIYYELEISDKLDGIYNLNTIFKVVKENQNNIGVYLYDKNYSDEAPKKGYYDAATNTFSFKEVVIKRPSKNIENEAEKDKWQKIEMPKDYENLYSYPDAKNDISFEDSLEYTVPNVFYFRMRNFYVKDGYKGMAKSGYSVSKPVTLDITNFLIPPVTNVRKLDLTDEESKLFGKYSWKIGYEGISLEKYKKYLLEPLGIVLNEKDEDALTRVYSTYLYNATSNIEEVFKELSKEDMEDEEIEPVKRFVLASEYEESKHSTYNGIIYDGNNSEGAYDLTKRINEKTSKTYQDYIRENGVVRFDTYSDIDKTDTFTPQETILFTGLEPNTPYAVQIRVQVERYKKEDSKWERIKPNVYSVFSKILTYTTTTEPMPPTPDEQKPMPPTNFWEEIEAKGKTTAVLAWEESEFAKTIQDPENVIYELVRVKDKELDSELNQKNVLLDTIKKKDNHFVYEAFPKRNEDDKDAVVKRSNGKTGKVDTFELWQHGDVLSFEDTELLPNTIYYYYIRTVYKTSDERSQFIMLPVTTDTLGNPINLTVESLKDYQVDNEAHEAVVSFWAPVPEGFDVRDGKTYDFEIAIRGDNDEQFYIANVDKERPYMTKYRTEVPIEGDYRKFVYTIKNLEHAKRYDVKVRLVDRTRGKDLEIRSIYSNIVSIRTNFSEEDYEKEELYKEYLEKYEQEANKLKTNPYWKVGDTKNEGTYKYRDAYLKSELTFGKDYKLVSEGDETLYYYLPKTALEIARQNNTMIEIVIGNYNAYLRPGIVYKNEAIKEAEEKIQKKYIADYYVSVEVNVENISSLVMGNKVILPEIAIDMEVVYLYEEESEVEKRILTKINELIEDGREDVIEGIEYAINSNRFSKERLDEIIEKQINYIKDKHAYETKRIMNKVVNKEAPISQIQKPLLVQVNVGDYTQTECYYGTESISWTKVYTYAMGTGIGFEAEKLGKYVITGKKQTTVIVPNIPGANNLITKYALTDFFTFDERGMQSYVTKEQLYGSLARIIGAPRDSNYVLALQNRGIKLVMPNNLYQTVRQDETIYVVMQAYEKMYYKPIQSIQITNKQSVQNIGAFQMAYRDYIYAAVQLEVVIPKNNKIDPASQVRAEDYIRMLTKITPK
ncbi:MAG: hypothetical protein ACRCSG_02480 [Cellulosilyticaceae bacterium]